jgi:protein translocase SecG subunit
VQYHALPQEYSQTAFVQRVGHVNAPRAHAHLFEPESSLWIFWLAVFIKTLRLTLPYPFLYNNADNLTSPKIYDMRQFLQFVNIFVMVLLIIIIALQNKSSGLSNVFGGGGNIVQTRRGFDKWLFYATIVFGTLFVGINVVFLFLKQ